MRDNLKEQILKFIVSEQATNKRLKDGFSNDDSLMLQFIAGKKVVLERLEELLQNSS